MNCDTGNLSYVDKVKLIANNMGNLIFDSNGWNRLLDSDDTTLQKVLDKIDNLELGIDIVGDTLVLDPQLESPHFTVADGVGLVLLKGEDSGVYDVQLPQNTTDIKLLTIGGLRDATYNLLDMDGSTLFTISNTITTFAKSETGWLLISSSDSNVTNVVADRVRSEIQPDIDNITTLNNETETLKSETETLRNETETLKSETETLKSETEVLSDIAVSANNVFADTTEGLANTSDTEYFYVVSESDDEILILYKNNSGTAESVKSIPRFNGGALEDTRATDISFAVGDSLGGVSLFVDNSGKLTVSSLEIKEAEGELLEPLKKFSSSEIPLSIAIQDALGNIGIAVSNEGKLLVKSLEVGKINDINTSTLLKVKKKYAKNYPAEIDMLLSYGQSLSIGSMGTPPISTISKYDNLMFNGGVLKPTVKTDFSPMVEETQETPISGIAEAIKQLIQFEDGNTTDDINFKLLGIANGVGGEPIGHLNKGTSNYTNFLQDILDGFDIAKEKDMFFKVSSVFWTQGEKDILFNTTYEDYRDKFKQLAIDFNTDIKEITTQNEDVQTICYQTYQDNARNINLAQYTAFKESNYITIACPLYWSHQQTHQTAENYKILGAYYGIAYKRLIIDKENWLPLCPTKVEKQGNTILVKFNVPSGKLVFDIAKVPQQPNYGFTVKDNNDVEINITNIAILNNDTVKIVAENDVSNGGVIEYGTSTLRGNLRDTQGDSLIFDEENLKHEMHNWAVVFQENF